MLRISTDKSKKSLLDDVYKYDWGDERYRWHDRASVHPSKRWVRRDFDWSCAVPILSRFLPLFFSVETGIQTVAEVNDLQRGLEPTKTEINIHKWGFGFSSPNPIGQPPRCDVRCVWTTLSRSRSYCTVWLFISALPFTFSKSPKIWSFHVKVAQEREGNSQKAWLMHVQSCCFAH